MAPQEDKTITSHNPAGERVSPEPINASSQSAKGQSPETDLGCSFPPQRMSACVLPGFCMLSVQNAQDKSSASCSAADDSFSVGPAKSGAYIPWSGIPTAAAAAVQHQGKVSVLSEGIRGLQPYVNHSSEFGRPVESDHLQVNSTGAIFGTIFVAK
ncbi:unnamed protein product [Caretta caretta]